MSVSSTNEAEATKYVPQEEEKSVCSPPSTVCSSVQSDNGTGHDSLILPDSGNGAQDDSTKGQNETVSSAPPQGSHDDHQEAQGHLPQEMQVQEPSVSSSVCGKDAEGGASVESERGLGGVDKLSYDFENMSLEKSLTCDNVKTDEDMPLEVNIAGEMASVFAEVKSELKTAFKDVHNELCSAVYEIKGELSHVLTSSTLPTPGASDQVIKEQTEVKRDIEGNIILPGSEIEPPTNHSVCKEVSAPEKEAGIEEQEKQACAKEELCGIELEKTPPKEVKPIHHHEGAKRRVGCVSLEDKLNENSLIFSEISTSFQSLDTFKGANDLVQVHDVKVEQRHPEKEASDSESTVMQAQEGIQDKLEDQKSDKEAERGKEPEKGLAEKEREDQLSRDQPLSAPCTPIPPAAGAPRKSIRLQGCRGRRVSFPEDDTRLISSYLEPVNPWQQMTGVTVEQIAAAYRASCERHRTQPLPTVVQQIKALPLGVGGRIECLSLRGQRLDGSQCEGLEEIFRRVQFKILDLEGCSLDDDTAIPLFDMIEFYDSATQLNISCNAKIGFRGWQACSRMLKRTPSVEYLDARNTNLNETNMPILGRALRLGARLHTLHLENCNLTGRPLIMLTAALKQNDTLAELYLAENRLGVNDCIQLGNLVRANSTLRLLDLRNNNVQDAGCGHVCEGIAEQQKQQLQEIEIGGANGKSKAIGLSSLVLWNNHLTQQAATHLACMLNVTTVLETLNLGRNNLTSEGILRLKESLLRNRALLRLGLQAARVADEGAVALAEYTADNTAIQHIDLRENPIRVAGLMALAHSLRLNSTIIQMDLDSDPRTEPAVELAEQHTLLQKEIKEYCQRNLTRSHLRATEVQVKDSQEASKSHSPNEGLATCIRKISLTCETSSKTTVMEKIEGPILEEEKPRYTSPDPSPLPSPSPSPCASPSPSPVPSPLKNRFRVIRVQESSKGTPQSPIGSFQSSVCSSAPATPTGRSMSSGDLNSLPKQSSVRPNRFSIGSRFTVTRVVESSGPCSLPSSHTKVSSAELTCPKPGAANTEGPKIVISSPVRVERGFSVDGITTSVIPKQMMQHTDSRLPGADGKADQNKNICESDGLPAGQTGPHTPMGVHVRLKSDSSDGDDVFLDSPCLNSTNGKCSTVFKTGCESRGSDKDSDSVSSSDLTDSGFLDEGICGRGGVSPSPSLSSPNPEGDRDSLLSSSVDSTSQEDTGLGSSIDSSILQGSLPSPTPLLSCNLQKTDKIALAEPLKRAPLASMENGSFDSDSEDSEVTTQSSDSTHSDEVRITTEQYTPRPAWESKPDQVNKVNSSESMVASGTSSGTC